MRISGKKVILLIAAILIVFGLAGFLIYYFFFRFDASGIYHSYTEVKDEAQEIEASFVDSSGLISPDDIPELLEQVSAMMNEKKEAGLVEYVESCDSGVFVKFTDNVGFLYTPQHTEMMEGDELKSIITIEPYPGAAEFVSHYILGGKSPDKSAQAIEDAIPDQYRFTDNVDEFLISDVGKLRDHSVILWYGHGGYVPEYGPVLGTSVSIKDKDALSRYAEELSSGQMVLGMDYILLAPSYFDKHLQKGDLNGSLLYLAACGSATDQRLADVFLEKGASLVVGNTRSVFIRYNLYMMSDFISGLTFQYDDGTFWTAEAALEYAKQENGERDGEFLFYGSEVKLIYPKGKSEYRLADAFTGERAEEDMSSTEKDLRNRIIPQYGQSVDMLSIPYHSYSSGSNGGYSGKTYFEIEEGSAALLGAKLGDYDRNGCEDILLVSLEADAVSADEKEKYGVPDGFCSLSFDVRVLCYDDSGRIIYEVLRRTELSPNIQETISLSGVGERVICSVAKDYEEDLDENGVFYSVTDQIGNHEDLLYVYSLSNGADIVFDYYSKREIGHVANIPEAEYVRYYMQWGDYAEQEILYFEGANSVSRHGEDAEPEISTDKYGKFDSEEAACERIASILRDTYGAYGFAIQPYNWEERWSNTFLPDDSSEFQLCSLTMRSTSSEQVAERETAGIMTLQINKPDKSNEKR